MKIAYKCLKEIIAGRGDELDWANVVVWFIVIPLLSLCLILSIVTFIRVILY